MTVLEQLNSGSLYLICGVIVAFIAVVCVVFMARAWRAGKALGMDTLAAVDKKRGAVTPEPFQRGTPRIQVICGRLFPESEITGR